MTPPGPRRARRILARIEKPCKTCGTTMLLTLHALYREYCSHPCYIRDRWGKP